MSQFAGKSSTTSSGTTAPTAVQRAAGKTTLVEQAFAATAAAAPGTPVQHKGGGDSPDVHATAAAGTAGSGGQLPHLDRIQQAFGRHDVSGVRAHTDAAAAGANAAMGAQAYARGNDVAFGGAPDLHTAAHEAAHVVQQRAGVHLKGGVGEHGDAYERHADAVADTVVTGGSAEALLSTMAGAPSTATAGGRGVQFHTPPPQGQPQQAQPPAAAKPLTAAEIQTKLTAGGALDDAAIRLLLDSLRQLAPLGDEKLAAGDAIATAINAASSPLVGDARWRAYNLRVFGPEAQWPPYLRGDTALTILAARKKIEAGEKAETVANALRPLNPTALHQVITVWRSDLPTAWFTAPMTRDTYLDLVMAASGGPSFAPAAPEAGKAPVIDPALHTRAQDAQYDYLKQVYDARGYTFKETGSDPKSAIEINVLNIRFYDMTVTGLASPKLTVNDYNGRLFVIYKDAGGKKVQSWTWSTTGPGASKQTKAAGNEQKLLKDNKFPTGLAGADAKIDPKLDKDVAASKDGVKLVDEAYTDWQYAVFDSLDAKDKADKAMQLSAARLNAGPGAAGAESSTKTAAREAGKTAIDAAHFIDTSVHEAKRAKAVFGKKRPADARDPDKILKDDADLTKDVQAALDRAGDAWALANTQESSLAEENARLAWEKALKDKGETAGQESSPETKAARAAYLKARTANNNGYGEGNPGKLSETQAIAWLQEGQYVAKYAGLKGGKDHWSVNANMDGEAAGGGIAPVYRDYNADGVIDPGEKDLPGTAVGTGILIHVGDGIGWSIGCQIAPAADFDDFTTLVEKLGAKTTFRYALVEAPHLPPLGAAAANPGAGNAGSGASGTPAKDAK
ncbi:MAG TPA: DUF4157 domain-containing protein [Kofleriaceae bacterium]|jgi:hypothetical protein|nr:DUF4157 domain-containing protein [Kofleriaceae bacterium]